MFIKKIFLIHLFSLISLLAIGQNTGYDTIRYAKKHYQKQVAVFNSEPVIQDRVIFLGNSLTQFGDWKKLLNDSTIVNRGIAGDNTYGVLDRLNDVIIRKPGKLFIEIGINDISQNIPSEIIERNILSIVRQLHMKSPGTKIYVLSILPTNDNVKNEYPAAYNKNDQVYVINGQLKGNARRSRYIYVDLINKLKDKNGQLDRKYADSDGLHLNPVGYNMWVKLLKTKRYL